MRFLAPAAIGYALFVLVGTDGMLAIISVWAMYVFLIRRKPARVYRRTR
jgi:hypothetical protein